MNKQVEATNKTIKDNLEKKLERLKGMWVNELSMVLLAHHTTSKEVTRETTFFLVFRTKVIIPSNVGLPSYRVENYSKQGNDIALLENSYFLEEKCDQASIRLAA